MNALVSHQRRSFVVTILVCFQLLAAAQPSASFTASVQSGCSPLIVHFSDVSTGNPSQWSWDLGNGAQSTLQHPSATYFNPGTYTIKLTVKNAAGIDSMIQMHYITVHANPEVSFSASDTTGCFPFGVQFNDNSTAGSGSVASWQWDFGDGSISQQQHPSHIYTSAGNYTVTLKVTNSYGCAKSLSKEQYIEATPGVQASFTYTAANLCAAPATLQFTNTSAGPGNLSSQWLFGDGSSSSDMHPSHMYTNNGTYTVSLITTSNQGCADTVEMAIPLGNQQADFTAPSTGCVNQPVTFTNTSSPLPTSVLWTFSDGATSTLLNPVRKFMAAGTYTIKLVSNFGGCKDSVTKQIIIGTKPVASFTADQQMHCKVPATVQFNSGGNGLTYLWQFGDGQTSTLQQPSHTYMAEGNYTVKLIVTNSTGCSDTLIKNNFIQIKEPVIQFEGLPATGCTPLEVNPSATVTGSIEPVQNWYWIFGDGTTSTSAAPSHVYGVAGNYDVTLVVTTASGCRDSVTMVNGVRAGNKPKANFGILNPEVCNLYPVAFVDSSTGNVDQWFWDFGDSYTSTEQNPSHVFGGIGYYDVTLIVWSNTCPDTIVKPNATHILPPIAGLSVQNNCDNKMMKQFTNSSIGATSWTWDFGDGVTSTQQHPVHTYAATGTYTVTLWVSNGTCTNVNYLQVRVIDEELTLTDFDVTCKGTVNQFNAPNVDTANIASWSWSFGDGTTSTLPAPLTHAYNATGNLLITGTIIDLNGCKDSAAMYVQVNGPTAHFNPSNSIVCLDNNVVSFSDSSYTDGLHPITQWSWNYGDGSFQTINNNGTVNHSYAATGQYTVRLIVKDASGCKDTALFSPVIVSKPHAEFYTLDTASCKGKNIQFMSQASGVYLTWNWNFGDGQTSGTKNPVHTYSNTGTYPVTLTMTDGYGCKDTLTKNNYISISMPVADFQLSDTFGTCPPLMVHFTNNATGYAQLHWDFGDGSTSALLNPSHYYTTAGTFYPRLIAKGPGGCTDTMVKKVVVQGPSGDFTYSPLEGCNPLTVNFTMNAQNAVSVVWDFSDGNTVPSSGNQISHIYQTTGDFLPRLILVDNAGCSVPIMGKDTVHVYDVMAGFQVSTDSLCGPGSIQLSNTSVSNDLISAYQWSFGDGNFSNAITPVHHYSQEGQYAIQLIATTVHGCKDTLDLQNAVRVLEKPVIVISGPESACMPATLQFGAQVQKGNAAHLNWEWNFGNGQTANTVVPDQQVYAQEGTYTVQATVTALNGCKDSSSHNVVIHPLPATNAGVDVSICRGSNVQLNATGAQQYSWSSVAKVSCDSCPSPMVAPETDAMFYVNGISAFGCIKTDSVLVTVHQPFNLSVEGNDTICIGGKVTLKATGADIYNWYPSAGIVNIHAATTSAMPQASTTYYVVAKDNNNCFTDTASVYIKVWPLPTVTAGIDQQLVVGDVMQLKATGSADVISWTWTPPAGLSCPTCPVTLAMPKQTTNYKVQVRNAGGCIAEDEVRITVICNNGNLLIPNTFSPNRDGVNDQFYPSGKGINMIKAMRVYNRWGQVVYERFSFTANDPSAGWDGTFKGQVLPPDVYVYTMEVVCQNNETLTYHGDITLLR